MTKAWEIVQLGGNTPTTEIDFDLVTPGNSAQGLGWRAVNTGTEALTVTAQLLEVPGSVGEAWYTGEVVHCAADGSELGAPLAVVLGMPPVALPGVGPGQWVRFTWRVDVPADAPLDFTKQPALVDVRAY